MKTLFKSTLAVLLAVSVFQAAAGAEVLTVAVFDFESKDEAVRDLGAKVAALVSADLSANPQIITVERAELAKALGEQEMGLSGTVSPETAAKVGHLTGAKVLVTGRVFKADEQTIIVAKVIGAETSRVYGEIAQGGPASGIADLSSALAKKIAADVVEKSATLTAKVETREERLAKLKQSVAGAKLPVVSVNIAERHYGPHIIDPAAATEISVILQQCGFTLADENSTNRPAIQISGEAFSAFGLQKGNLISCTARVEIKAREAATGEILVVDRQTSVAVDVSEQTAAKQALENAADALAARVLPKLTKQ
jgi:TolB-like protein